MKERLHDPSTTVVTPSTPLLDAPAGEPLSARALAFSEQIRARIDRQLGRDAARTHAFRRQSTGQ